MFKFRHIVEVRTRRRDFNDSTLFNLAANSIVKNQAYFCYLAHNTGRNPFDYIRKTTKYEMYLYFLTQKHHSKHLASKIGPQKLLRFERRVCNGKRPIVDAAAEQRGEQRVFGEHSQGGQACDEERH